MKWVLITGGAKNLGGYLSEYLAMRGYSVVIHYNKSKKEAKALSKKIQDQKKQAQIIQGDFSLKSSFEDFLKRYFQAFGDTSILINNVGNYHVGSLLDTPNEIWYELFQVNLTAPYLLAKHLFESIRKNKGSIVNLGFAGLLTHMSNAHSSVYTLTKSGLWTLTKMLAKLFVQDQVNVNMVSPGFLEKSIEYPKQEGLLVQYEEIARLICFLLEEKSKSITGQNIEISKGVRL